MEIEARKAAVRLATVNAQLQQYEAIKRRDNGETLTEIASSYNISHTTIFEVGGMIFSEAPTRVTGRCKAPISGLWCAATRRRGQQDDS